MAQKEQAGNYIIQYEDVQQGITCHAKVPFTRDYKKLLRDFHRASGIPIANICAFSYKQEIGGILRDIHCKSNHCLEQINIDTDEQFLQFVPFRNRYTRKMSSNRPMWLHYKLYPNDAVKDSLAFFETIIISNANFVCILYLYKIWHFWPWPIPN